MKQLRFLAAGLAGVFLAAALACSSWAALEYEPALIGIEQLQQLAMQFEEENSVTKDSIVLTLDYIRTAQYNSSEWQMAAGAPRADFAEYVQQQGQGLELLQDIGTVTIPDTGETLDMQHMLAALDLCYQGVYLSGSWGGDCMQLAEQIGGGSFEECYAAAQPLLGAEDEAASSFSQSDLLADMDAVNLSALLNLQDGLAFTIREYYADINGYDRAAQFVANQFGAADTGDRDAFRQTVYDTLTGDDGMQLLLYFGEHWQRDGWQLDPDFEAPLRAVSYALADYLSDQLDGAVIGDVQPEAPSATAPPSDEAASAPAASAPESGAVLLSPLTSAWAAYSDMIQQWGLPPLAAPLAPILLLLLLVLAAALLRGRKKQRRKKGKRRSGTHHSGESARSHGEQKVDPSLFEFAPLSQVQNGQVPSGFERFQRRSSAVKRKKHSADAVPPADEREDTIEVVLPADIKKPKK